MSFFLIAFCLYVISLGNSSLIVFYSKILIQTKFRLNNWSFVSRALTVFWIHELYTVSDILIKHPCVSLSFP